MCVLTSCRKFLLLLPLAISVVAPVQASEPSPDQIEFFEKKVRPVLAEHCYECHSSDGKKVKGGLVLDSRAGWEKGGDSGPTIVPGDPDKSLLIQAVRHADSDLKMPKQKIAEHEIAALAEWVKMGAPDPRTGELTSTPRPAFDWEKERQHWAYQPVREPVLPEVKDTTWPQSPIDRFILANLEKNQLPPVGDADKRTLLRRATYDLTGLPPTPEELHAFLEDTSPQAFERVVDRLLASRAYGERWGRHWMDLVRYADTAGDNSDFPVPQAYLYRNYLIEAFNADKPFDQFIREQIAGDLLPARDQVHRNEQVIATGYIAQSRRFGSVIDRYPQHLTIEDTLDNLGKTFLGLTLACARCHDHKFDAISQRDYYALYGMFASTRYAFPGIELLQIQKDFVPLVSQQEVEERMKPHQKKEAELKSRKDSLAKKSKDLENKKRDLRKALDGVSGEEKKKLEGELGQLEEQIKTAKKDADEAKKALEAHEKNRPRVPDAYAVQDDKPVDARMHLKGEPKRLGETVPRRWLEIFGGQALREDVAAKTSGRLQLADWIADPANPLSSRVIVNRLWQYHFGAGIVKTPSDFGVRGQAPSNPELLDWLASRFVAEGWSVKRMHKLIMLSRTYQLASTENSQALAVDPENRWHWRYNRRRLDAESFRDTLLALSGTLDPTPMKEPHPFPSPEKWKYTQHHPFKDTYKTNRRSVYLMGARLNALPFFQTFDGPDRNATTPTRDSSVTTVQALYFLNDEFLHEQVDRFADRLMREASETQSRLSRAFLLSLQREPRDEERASLDGYFAAAREKLTAAGMAPEKHDRLIWASFARALFRTNEFLYND